MKLFNVFSRPLAAEIRRKTIEEYERDLLNSEAAASYHQKMVEYYREGIQRLHNNQGINP